MNSTQNYYPINVVNLFWLEEKHHTSHEHGPFIYHFNWMNSNTHADTHIRSSPFYCHYYFGIRYFESWRSSFSFALFHYNIAHVMDFKLDKATNTTKHNKTNQYKTICTRSLSQTFSPVFSSSFVHIALSNTVAVGGFFIVGLVCMCVCLSLPQLKHLVQFIRMIDLYEAPHCANEQKWDNNSVWGFIRFLVLFDKHVCVCACVHGGFFLSLLSFIIQLPWQTEWMSWWLQLRKYVINVLHLFNYFDVILWRWFTAGYQCPSSHRWSTMNNIDKDRQRHTEKRGKATKKQPTNQPTIKRTKQEASEQKCAKEKNK